MKHVVYQCQHSGLYLPADYIDRWGSKYGIGLGPTPVSECLNTMAGILDTNSMLKNQYIGDPADWMLPVGETYAAIEREQVTEEELGGPVEQFFIKENFRRVGGDFGNQYEKVGEERALMPVTHPDYQRGNRMIMRCHDKVRTRIDAVLREKQKKNLNWSALQALIGNANPHQVEGEKVWA